MLNIERKNYGIYRRYYMPSIRGIYHFHARSMYLGGMYHHHARSMYPSNIYHCHARSMYRGI